MNDVKSFLFENITTRVASAVRVMPLALHPRDVEAARERFTNPQNQFVHKHPSQMETSVQQDQRSDVGEEAGSVIYVQSENNPSELQLEISAEDQTDPVQESYTEDVASNTAQPHVGSPSRPIRARPFLNVKSHTKDETSDSSTDSKAVVPVTAVQPPNTRKRALSDSFAIEAISKRARKNETSFAQTLPCQTEESLQVS